MDRMEEWEIPTIVSGLPMTDRNLWEQTRLRIYSLASMFSKGERTLQDIMTFPWEEVEVEHIVDMSNEDRERLRARAEAIAKTLK